MFAMTVDRRNLQLLKGFILNGRFSLLVFVNCIEFNIRDPPGRGERSFCAARNIKSPLNPGVITEN